MMTKGYDEAYLSDVMETLGVMFDYGVNALQIDIDEFADCFLYSIIAQEIASGNPFYLGKSGVELAQMACRNQNMKIKEAPYCPGLGKSPEYWLGYTLAYYQWSSGYRFETILSAVRASDMLKMYPTLHEADIRKFCEIMDEKIKSSPTNLKRIRAKIGFTQKELARKSGVSERTIKSYEQRENDINKAQVNIVRAFTFVLGCRIEDILE